MPYICQTCNKALARSDSLQRHQLLMHSKSMLPHQKKCLNQSQTSHKRTYDEMNEDEDTLPTQIQKRCKYFYPIAAEAFENTCDRFEEALSTAADDSVQDDGFYHGDEEETDEAFAEMEVEHEKAFFQVYKDYLKKALYTRKSRLHQKVLAHAVELHKLNVPAKDAVKMSVRKYKDDFDTAEFVKHAGTVDDSEEETDEEDKQSDASSCSDDDDESSNSGVSSESDNEESNSSEESQGSEDSTA